MKDLIHVGFTNSGQIDYAKEDQGSFYSDPGHGCNIPLYMLDAHSLRALNSEVVNSHEKMQTRIKELEKTIAEMRVVGNKLAGFVKAAGMNVTEWEQLQSNSSLSKLSCKSASNIQLPESSKDVHTEHCCTIHGCKYGSTDCTVVKGLKEQSFPCEDCSQDNDTTEEQPWC